MTTNHADVDALPQDVYGVLTDAYAYAKWVVGSKRVRGVDPNWPAVGARFHHTVGPPGVDIKDSSKLVELEENRRVVLEVRFRPAGVAVVAIDLEPLEGGRRTHITMMEHPRSGPVRKWWSMPLEIATSARNAISLRRLARLCERRAHASV
jgi:uncharacterized protein YndB with AHSA1/START domain